MADFATPSPSGSHGQEAMDVKESMVSSSSSSSPEYNYVVTAHRPTVVTHAVVCSFTGPSEKNLILAKSSCLEIRKLAPTGLVSVTEIPIYGKIAVFLSFRYQGESQDCLFVCTDRNNFCVLGWNMHRRTIQTRASGSLRQRNFPPVESEEGPIGLVDAEHGIIGLHLYEGIFQYLRVGTEGKMENRPYELRLDELNVISMCFLAGHKKPVLLVLYCDFEDALYIKTYSINLREASFERGPWSNVIAVHKGASKLVPIPSPLGGVVVISSEQIAYIDGTKTVDQRINASRIECIAPITKDRYLVGDVDGRLSMLILRHNGRDIRALQLEEDLGVTSKASTLSYLDNAYVYVGSAAGDSQLICLKSEKQANGSYFQEVKRDVNLGPILDFCVVDLDRQGQGLMVTCSGCGKDGSLRVVRNGIGITPDAVLEIDGLQGLWSLKKDTTGNKDQYLALSFAAQTYVMAVSEQRKMDVDARQGEPQVCALLEEVSVSGFDHASATLFAANMTGDCIVQATDREIRVISCLDLALRSKWSPAEGQRIQKAHGSGKFLLVVTGGNKVTELELQGNNELKELNTRVLETEVSCLCIAKLDSIPTSSQMNIEGASPSTASGETHVAAIGMWDNKGVLVAALPGLKTVAVQSLGDNAIARSIGICKLGSIWRLFCGMGDGQLIVFELQKELSNPSKTISALSSPNKVTLGTNPVSITCFENKSGWHVMASCDRPTVVYCAKNSSRLLYNNVNLKNVRHMATFRSAASPNALAFATQNSLMIGTADAIQKLHVSTFPLKEQPRRIAHQPETNSFLVCVEPCEEGEPNAVRIADGQSYEFIVSMKLKKNEVATSVTSLKFALDNRSFYAVGTAFILPKEEEPTKGRILILQFLPSKQILRTVANVDTPGTVYCMESFQGKLLAGINSQVQLYSWEKGTEEDIKAQNFIKDAKMSSASKLLPLCSHRGHIVALYLATHGSFFVVGDLMKSEQLLMYKEEQNAIVELARDFTNRWMTSVAMLDDQVFIGTEDNCNMFTLKRNILSLEQQNRRTLEVVGKFHLGEFVNRFRKGSLVMQLPETKGNIRLRHLFGTVNGVIGVVASLSQTQYRFLRSLESALERVVKGVGGFSHKEYRSCLKPRSNNLEENLNFIDGDLVEKFLSLGRGDMEKVAILMNKSVEYILRQVEVAASVH